MASITLKNIPSALHKEVKAKAREHKRSLTQQTIVLLEEAMVRHRPVDVKAMLAREQKLRLKLQKQGVWATPEDIDRFKREGRE